MAIDISAINNAVAQFESGRQLAQTTGAAFTFKAIITAREGGPAAPYTLPRVVLPQAVGGATALVHAEHIQPMPTRVPAEPKVTQTPTIEREPEI